MNFFQFLWLYSPIWFFPLEILLDQISCLLDLSAISVNFSLKFYIFVYLFYNHRIDFTLSFSSHFFFLATSSSLQDFSSLTGDWTWTTAVKVSSSNHWTARKFPNFSLSSNLSIIIILFNLAILCGNHKNSFKFSGCSFSIATCSYFYGWTTL